MGTAIRIAIVIAWLALLAQQTLRHVLPGLGLVERRDAAASLAAQLDRTLTYRMRRRAAPAEGDGREVGTWTFSCQRDEERFRLDTTVLIDLDGVLPPGAALLPGMPPGLAGLGPQSRLRLQATQRLDDRLRLMAVEGTLELGPIHGSLTGTVDHRGLVGSWRLHSSHGQFALPQVRRDGDQRLDSVLALPSGLRPGERFRSPLLDLDMGLAAHDRTAVYRVDAREEIATAGGSLALLRVAMTVDGRARATYWCDDLGTVYRADLESYGMLLELTAITRAGGGRIWPEAGP